jgi:hypothetical protein
MPCHTTNVACVPNGKLTGSVKLVSPTTKNRTAATAPAYALPLSRHPTTAVSSTASAHSPGTVNRSATTGRSMSPIMLVAAMCT